jgi:hypothetical protein
MSVQVMYRDASRGMNAAPAEYAQSGYEASFGSYQIEDERTLSAFMLREHSCGR